MAAIRKKALDRRESSALAVHAASESDKLLQTIKFGQTNNAAYFNLNSRF